MNANMTNLAEENNYSLEELQKESRMGALGQETFEREVRVIDLSDFEQRKYDIADQLWSAATDIGFFQVSNHGIDLDQIKNAFEMTENFFNLPEHIKAQYPLNRNAGWESKAQIRPSTSTPDQKNLIKSLVHEWMAYILLNKNYRFQKYHA
jgi:isopenicillin N synthase-like dioxygenase